MATDCESVPINVVSNETLDNIRGSLQDGCRKLKDLSNFGGDGNGKNDCSTRKAKLALSKQEYRKLKQDSQTLQTKLQMLDYLVNVNEENWPTMQSKDDEYKQVYEDKKQVNCGLLDMEDDILELVERAQEESTALQDKISTMEQKLLSIVSKKQRYEELYKQHTECLAKCQLPSLNKSHKISDVLKQQEERIEVVETSLKKCTSLEATLTDSIAHHRANLQQIKDTIKTGLEMLQAIADENKEKRLKIFANIKRCEDYSALNSKLFRVSENTSSGKSLSVDLAPSNDDNDKVTLVFDRHHSKPHQYSDVKIGSDTNTVDMNSSAKEAMDCNDICYVLQEIRKQFTTHAPLAKEINSLRQRFAIDFLQDENVLVCMLGSCGNIVCRLKIESGYPSSGHISLQKITGQPEDTMSNFQPSMENPTLTDWLDHLQQMLV